MPASLTPLQGAVFGLILLPFFCIACEKLWPSVRGQRVLREQLGGDVIWYFVQGVVQRSIAPVVVGVLFVWPFFALSGRDLADYWEGFGPLAELHLGWQMLIIYVVFDFFSYWQHRAFHGRALWRIHAVHHSSKRLDWIGSARFHPLNEIGVQLVCVPPLICLGLSPTAMVLMTPFTGAYAVFLHANVRWDFGPLRYVIASPLFHRWHHTCADEGRNKNFAGALPIWDILFGTLYFPKGEQPEVFGIDEPMPAGFWRQLIYPFRRPSAASAPAPASSRSPEPN